jgi:hypothetical protein
MVDILVSLLAFAAAILLAWKFPAWSGLRDRVEAVERRTDALLRMSARMGIRQARLSGELDDAAGERVRAEGQRALVRAELATVEALNEAALRIVDDDHHVPGALPWLFLVVNRRVETMAARGGGSYFFDPSWARPQAVVVAAASLERARSLVEQRFPEAFGFTVVKTDAAPPHLARMYAASAPVGAQVA